MSATSLAGRRRVALEEVGRRHEDSRRAEAALERVALPERLLQRVELPVHGEPLDRLGAQGRRPGRRGAGTTADGDPVEEHRAGAADAVLAADVRAGQAERVAEEVGEEQARLGDGLAVAPAVHRDLDP